MGLDGISVLNVLNSELIYTVPMDLISNGNVVTCFASVLSVAMLKQRHKITNYFFYIRKGMVKSVEHVCLGGYISVK